MLSRIQTFVLAVTLALCLVKAAASPIEGAWEGSRNGAKTAVVTITRTGGILGGSAIFYILRDNGEGSHNGEAMPALPLTGVQWDGRTLRFSVKPPGTGAVSFELRLTGAGRAELRRSSADPDESVPMILRK